MDYEKNIASVIAMLHQRVKLWMPNYAPVDEIRRIKEAVGEALDANARRNDELITIRARVAELEAELARIQRLPDLEWAQVTAIITRTLADVSRHGFKHDAKAMLEALDRGKTYVDRILAAK